MDKHEKQNYYEMEWLGLVINDPSLWQERTINDEHFYSKQNDEVYRLLDRFIEEGRPIDNNAWITLSEDEQQAIGGRQHIEACKRKAITNTAENAKRLEKEMQTYHIATSMMNLIEPLTQSEAFDIENCRTIAEDIQKTVEGVRTKRKTFKEVLFDTHQQLMSVSDEFSGIPTGYKALDKAFDGWQTGDLITVAARPSMGKTAITVNFALESAKEGQAVTYIPAETGESSIVRRAISILGKLPVNAMRNPKKYLSKEQMDTYKETITKLLKLPLHIEELHYIGDIRQLARERTKAEPNKKHLFIIDHLAHIKDHEKYQSRTIEYESYCQKLKDIAKEYNIAVMLLSQLSRGVEQRPDKRPMMSDLRDSGGIEQISDVIAMLYRDSYYKKDGEKPVDDIIEFQIVKNRDGGTGTTELLFIPETNQVLDE